MIVTEILKLIQVRSYARVERIVDQDKQRKRSVISLCRNYLVYLEGVLALFHLHVHRPENGRLVVITECLVRDHHVNLDRAEGGSHLWMCDSCTQYQHTDRTAQARRYFEIVHDSPLLKYSFDRRRKAVHAPAQRRL